MEENFLIFIKSNLFTFPLMDCVSWYQGCDSIQPNFLKTFSHFFLNAW